MVNLPLLRGARAENSRGLTVIVEQPVYDLDLSNQVAPLPLKNSGSRTLSWAHDVLP